MHTLHSAQETPPQFLDLLSSTPHLLLLGPSYSSLSPTQPLTVCKRPGVSHAFLAPAWPNLAPNSLSSWPHMTVPAPPHAVSAENMPALVSADSEEQNTAPDPQEALGK